MKAELKARREAEASLGSEVTTLISETMASTSRLYDALHQFVSQFATQWQDARHLQTLCWMMVGMLHSQNVHLNGSGVYVHSRANFAQSHQRRFRRWLANRRIKVSSPHQALVNQALSCWGTKRLYLSLDTTLVWNCFCIIWVGVVYRERMVPISWRVVVQSSSSVRLWAIQRVVRQAQRVLPASAVVVLLADRGFADGKLMKYLNRTLGWHFRIRIKRSFAFYYQKQWRNKRCAGATGTSVVYAPRGIRQNPPLRWRVSRVCPRQGQRRAVGDCQR